MKIRVAFFKTSRGDEPVMDYLDALSKTAQTKIYGCLDVLRKDGYLGAPHGKKLAGTHGLYEVRSGKHRILYCIHNAEAIMFHAFVKTTKKTPKKELNIAIKRMKLFKRTK